MQVVTHCSAVTKTYGSAKHTPGHVNCPACPQKTVKDLHISPTAVFEQAIDLYLEARGIQPRKAEETTALASAPSRDIAPSGRPGPGQQFQPRLKVKVAYLATNTENSYRQYADALKLFFSGMRLCDIGLEHIQGYQLARLNGDDMFVRYRRPQDAKPRNIGGQVLPPVGPQPCPVKPKKINQELSLLQMLLRRVGLWGEKGKEGTLADTYELVLEEEADVSRALTVDEQELWLRTAAAYRETEVVYWYSLAAFDVLCSTDEMRQFHVGDIHLQQFAPTVRVQRGKCDSRARTIGIESEDARWAFGRLVERAQECGASSPMHFLFPFRGRGGRHGKWVPTQGMSNSGLKKQWQQVQERSGLTWFRAYDTRHTGITRLAETGVPIAIIKQKAGHISDKMSAHYTQVSEAAASFWAQESARRQQRMRAIQVGQPGGQRQQPQYRPQDVHPVAVGEVLPPAGGWHYGQTVERGQQYQTAHPAAHQPQHGWQPVANVNRNPGVHNVHGHNGHAAGPEFSTMQQAAGD